MEPIFLPTSAATTTVRRLSLVEEEGLASLIDIETGVSRKNHLFLSAKRESHCMSFSSPRFGFFYEEEPPRHFLSACYLCKKPLGQNTDIFMYRGDTPFCSEGCRQEQMDVDEALEKNRCMSIRAASSKKDPQKSATKKGKTQSFNLRAGTVVAG